MRIAVGRLDLSAFAGLDAFRLKHILIRDAAYDSIPIEVRARMSVVRSKDLDVIRLELLQDAEEPQRLVVGLPVIADGIQQDVPVRQALPVVELMEGRMSSGASFARDARVLTPGTDAAPPTRLGVPSGSRERTGNDAK